MKDKYLSGYLSYGHGMLEDRLFDSLLCQLEVKVIGLFLINYRNFVIRLFGFRHVGLRGGAEHIDIELMVGCGVCDV